MFEDTAHHASVPSFFILFIGLLVFVACSDLLNREDNYIDIKCWLFWITFQSALPHEPSSFYLLSFSNLLILLGLDVSISTTIFCVSQLLQSNWWSTKSALFAHILTSFNNPNQIYLSRELFLSFFLFFFFPLVSFSQTLSLCLNNMMLILIIIIFFNFGVFLFIIITIIISIFILLTIFLFLLFFILC